MGSVNAHNDAFNVLTDLQLNEEMKMPLLPEHIELIGSFPEEWIEDNSIDQKINNTAKHLFGMSVSQKGFLYT